MSEPSRTPSVMVTLDGSPLALPEGLPLASALLAAGIRRLRHSPAAGGPRGAFCLMGVCQECVVSIDGEVRQACLTPVVSGMMIATGSGP